MKLIINNIEIELPKTKISRTLQVNDIISLSNRQSNYTNTISAPRTTKNINAFGKLGVIGVNSQTPYQRNETYLYADSGECLVYNGWSIIKSTDKDFKLNIYDGNIDIYKSIENRTLNEVDLSEVNHLKTFSNVVNSWLPTSKYRYILADYNGKTSYGASLEKINIDYLIPSINVAYLWQKVFDYFGYTYSGSVFSSFNFQNLWLTFPKGITSILPDEQRFTSDDVSTDVIHLYGTVFKSAYLSFDTSTINAPTTLYQDRHIRVNESGIYRVEVTGSLLLDTGLYSADFKLNIGKNADSITYPISLNSSYVVGSGTTNFSTTFDYNQLITLNDTDSICFFVRAVGAIQASDTNLTITLSKVVAQDIDFDGALIDFKVTDFFNEIITRFGLSLYKDKYSNNYKFLTLEELLQDNDVIDWSDKFVGLESESYVYGNYAQNNVLSYKYNDEGSDFNDGAISINNVNLEDTKQVIASKIFSPERLQTKYFDRNTNVYKLFEKDIKDDGSINYKSLDKKFYFMRSDNYIFDETKIIGSETLGIEQTITQAPVESFFKLSFYDIVNDYYSPFQSILNNAKIHNIAFYLNDYDIANIDFSKIYYVRQLNQYYILNKISNYQEKGINKAEMIKVDYTPDVDVFIPPISITINDVDYDGGCVYFTPDYGSNVNVEVSSDSGLTWSSYVGSGISPMCGFTFSFLDNVRLKDLEGNIISDTFPI